MSTFRRLSHTAQRLYQRVFQRQADVQTRSVINTLAEVGPFAECTRSTLFDVAEAMHHRTYRRNEYLYHENDPGLGLFVIEKGRVQLTAEGQQDATYTLSQLGPYAMFGTLSLLGDFRRMETAQALTETKVLGFFRPDLKNLAKRNPRVGTEVLGALARHVAQQHVDMINLLSERVGRSTALHTFAEATAQSSDAASIPQP